MTHNEPVLWWSTVAVAGGNSGDGGGCGGTSGVGVGETKSAFDLYRTLH